MQKLPPVIPWWARLLLFPLVVVMPLLGILAIVFRVAFRNQPPRVRYAWTAFLSTLLIVSGFLTSAGAVLLFSFGPVPSMVNSALPDFDERAEFPVLPADADLTAADASSKLKPLVIVISPPMKRWHQAETASNAFGAGVLVLADKDGYLFATANHVAMHTDTRSGKELGHVLVSTASGLWAKAQVVATAPSLDLALLWLPRHSGSATFVQPIAPASDGANVFVIGHPEGLNYTLSTGIVSGLRDRSIQISAAVSPGNSGGPVYDSRGNLLAIVSSKFDRNFDANAENLSFASRADALLHEADWTFGDGGEAYLKRYIAAEAKLRDHAGKDEAKH